MVNITGSTNEDLARRAKSGEPGGVVLCAEEQSAGRGRLMRQWQSPPSAGLAVSALLRPETPASTWGLLSLLSGVALAEALREDGGVRVGLKWPNDVLIGPLDNPRHPPPAGNAQNPLRKCAGILATGSPGAVVIGVGLNVTLTAEELPHDNATSLLLCGGNTDREALLIAFLRRFEHHYLAWMRHHGDAEASGVLEAWRRDSDTLGREVSVSYPDGSHIVGRAEDVNRDGQLVLKYDSELVNVSAGDIHHLRSRQ
ncbi:biotin--[acetyl-CoA-carboxylase] ligase [Natronoglycomyces albus]|uniref:biotin--[biotin carboxyl-carrier protein] ligase n=1 Tax=Natronoglycomyces albus TaxID=2811108 RepID=A0A895XTS6_9ACTN|nr:biotin--[acetyl-CoA-carboxylase] ligase [Natronoglycomyces albus]QSB05926.1 biotin--[acetyl-CoA-carboxylase] ligase [Natronoglycomyces albus]